MGATTCLNVYSAWDERCIDPVSSLLSSYIKLLTKWIRYGNAMKNLLEGAAVYNITVPFVCTYHCRESCRKKRLPIMENI